MCLFGACVSQRCQFWRQSTSRVPFRLWMRLFVVLDDDGLLVTYFNMSMRVRHLLVLLGLCLNSQADVFGFNASEDVEEILSNMRNCFRTCHETGKIDTNKGRVKCQEDFEFYSHFHSYLFRLILNNSIMRGHVFQNRQITRFIMDLWTESKVQQANLNEKSQMSKYFEQYLSILLGKLEKRELELHTDHYWTYRIHQKHFIWLKTNFA